MKRFRLPSTHPRLASALGIFLFLLWCGSLQLIAQTASATTTLSPAAPNYADTVTATVTLTGSGPNQPTGTITYSVDGGSSQTATVNAGSSSSAAYLNVNPLPPGSHTLTVSYSGDGNYQALSGSSLNKTYTVTDLPFALRSSSYPLTAYVDDAENGGSTYLYGSSGIAVDAHDNVYITFGTTSSGVAPSITEITSGLKHASVNVTGLGHDTQLATDAQGNLYIADPENARVIEYNTSGAQTTLNIAGLMHPASITYDKAANALFILDTGVGGAIEYPLSSHTATTVFSGMTSLNPAIASDGNGGIYFAQNGQLLFRGSNGAIASIFGEFNNGNTANGICGLAYNQGTHELWINNNNNVALYHLDAQRHAMIAAAGAGTAAQVGISVSSGEAYTTGGVVTVNPTAANAGPGAGVNGQQSPYAQAYFSFTWAEGGSPSSPGLNYALDLFTITPPNGYGVGNGLLSWSFPATSPDGITVNIPVYGTGYLPWIVTSPGAVAPLSQTITQPGGMEAISPLGGRGTTIYFSDQSNNTVSSLFYVTNATGPGSVFVPGVRPVQQLAFTGLTSPSQIAADGAGNTWVLDGSGSAARILMLDNKGNQTTAYSASSGDPAHQLSSLTAFTIDGADALILGGSGSSNGAIVRIDPSGFETILATGIQTPALLAVDGFRNVFSIDASGTLTKTDAYGTTKTVASGLPQATAISVDPADEIYLSSASGNSVLVVGPDGSQSSITIPGVANPAFAVADYFGGIHAVDGTSHQLYVDYRFSPTFDFGNVAVNSTSKQDFTIVNIGDLTNGPLTEYPFQSPTSYDPFAWATSSTNPCPITGSSTATLVPGASCNVAIQYAPTKLQSDSASTDLESDGNALFGTTVNLFNFINVLGTGSTASAGTPNPVLTPPSLDFGSVHEGKMSTTQNATLSNTGTAPLSVTSINIVGGDARDFSQTNNCGTSVNAGASCTIAVACSPQDNGSLSATLAVNYPSPLPQQTVALSCTGLVNEPPAGPQATLTPGSANFGNVTIGNMSTSQTFTLANAGGAALPVNSISIVGTNASDFSIVNNACGTSLNAGASCAIAVAFKPSASGSETATIAVTDSVGNQTSSLTGTGVAATTAPADFTIAATPSTQTISSGTAAAYTVQLDSADAANPFTNAVSLAATGLPNGATVSFSTPSLVPGVSQPTTSMMTITVPAQTAQNGSSFGWPGGASLAAAALFFCVRRRHKLLMAASVLLLAATSIVGITGCGSRTGFAMPAGPGTSSPSPTTSTITVTGTSGSISHSTTVTLTVR